jgi:hypothetical protein
MPDHPSEATPPPDQWDEGIAAELPGCLILVGFTYLQPDGSLDHHKQMYGYVLEVDRDRGIQLRLEGADAGKAYWLPPDTRPFRRAPEGEYRLRSTGEVVNDPDYTCAWTVRTRKQG